jgi:hypothetical protein
MRNMNLIHYERQYAAVAERYAAAAWHTFDYDRMRSK